MSWFLPDDINELVECYNSTLKSVQDKHAPLKTKVIVERPRVPWFNEEIKDAMRKQRKAERKWRSSRQAADLASFKYRRNQSFHSEGNFLPKGYFGIWKEKLKEMRFETKLEGNLTISK